MGLVIGIPTITMDALSGQWMPSWKYFFLPVISGFLSATGIILLHVVRLRKLGVKNLYFHPKQTTFFEAGVSKFELLEKLRSSPGIFKIWDLDDAIEYRTGDLLSGFSVEINFIKNENNKPFLKVTSRPAYRYTFIDFGVSWEQLNYVKQIAK